MDTSWKIVFPYRLSSEKNAQAIYDEILRVALQCKFNKTGLWAIPVNPEIITSAIFDLNSHDTVRINGKEITGQQLKELFVTTIFLKLLEKQLASGTPCFVVLPETVSSCDTAVIVMDGKDQEVRLLDMRRMKISPEHLEFLFQVKEYFNFEAIDDEALILPREIDVGRIEKMVAPYSEIALVFLRELFEYRSDYFQEFFEAHPNCYLISSPHDITRLSPDSKTQATESVPLDKDKHNYVITFSGSTFAVVSFDRPKFLIDNKTMRKMLPQ